MNKFDSSVQPAVMAKGVTVDFHCIWIYRKLCCIVCAAKRLGYGNSIRYKIKHICKLITIYPSYDTSLTEYYVILSASYEELNIKFDCNILYNWVPNFLLVFLSFPIRIQHK